MRLLAFGGSQGARIMSEIVPPAIEQLDASLRARPSLAQQARDEDLARVRDIDRRLSVVAEVSPFFPDLPARIAAVHFVVARSGAIDGCGAGRYRAAVHSGAVAGRTRPGSVR